MKKFRLGKGLTQEALGRRARLHGTYISGIENGRRNPTLEKLYALADALEVNPCELL